MAHLYVVDLPSKNGWIFPVLLYVYQKVYHNLTTRSILDYIGTIVTIIYYISTIYIYIYQYYHHYYHCQIVFHSYSPILDGWSLKIIVGLVGGFPPLKQLVLRLSAPSDGSSRPGAPRHRSDAAPDSSAADPPRNETPGPGGVLSHGTPKWTQWMVSKVSRVETCGEKWMKSPSEKWEVSMKLTQNLRILRFSVAHCGDLKLMSPSYIHFQYSWCRDYQNQGDHPPHSGAQWWSGKNTEVPHLLTTLPRKKVIKRASWLIGFPMG